jgi:hypothetical protein
MKLQLKTRTLNIERPTSNIELWIISNLALLCSIKVRLGTGGEVVLP